MAVATARSDGIIYFGKIPSRGDFVRSANGSQVIALLDTWVSQSMELLSVDPLWKSRYDAASPINFAFVGTQSRRILSGHLAASNDLSSRRFPFITSGSTEVEDPLAFLARCPILLSRHWHRLRTLTQKALGPENGEDVLDAINDAPIAIEPGVSSYECYFRDFLEMQTIGSLEAILVRSSHRIVLRQSVLALGLLLQPLLEKPGAALQKGLALPLPADDVYGPLVASFWLELIHPFFARGDFELGLFLTQWNGKHGLFIGFNGASSRALQALFDVSAGRDYHVDIGEAEWVEDYIAGNNLVGKLSTYMAHPQLSLRQLGDTFREVFFDV